MRDAVDMGYDLQAYMYGLARSNFEGTCAAAPFVFVTVETSPANSVCCLVAGESFLDNAAAKLLECMTTFKACTWSGIGQI